MITYFKYNNWQTLNVYWNSYIHDNFLIDDKENKKITIKINNLNKDLKASFQLDNMKNIKNQ